VEIAGGTEHWIGPAERQVVIRVGPAVTGLMPDRSRSGDFFDGSD
jgi:hypothetical protein